MSDTVKWGILGTGSIANKFAEGLKSASGAEIVAVGSRMQDKADAFGQKFDIPHRHASYEALANDPQVQVIYVATPHVLHKENSILCLSAGKAVLCEKPFTINAAQAREVVQTARQKKRFLMEAMWSRFLPTMTKARELIAAGAIGQVRMVTADFGFRAGWNPSGRLLNPALGGGALLDVGVYTISFASMILGKPKSCVGMAHIGETNVDEQSAMVLQYDQGALAVLCTAVRTNTPHDARIMGTDGSIYLPAFWHGSKLVLNQAGKETQTIDLPLTGNGYNYQAVEVMNCLRDGATESSVMPLDETVSVMETMDGLRKQWGMKYPGE